jgi:signal transduction histidine kinase
VAQVDDRFVEQHELMRVVVDDAPIAMAFLDREFRYVLVNKALSVLQGRQHGSQIGRTVAEIVPSIWPEVEPLFRRVLAGESFLDQELSGIAPPIRDATHFRVSYYPVRLEGDVVGIGVMAADVSRRHHVDRALALRSDLYQMLSRTNSAIARCRTPDALYRGLCAIAVETGHFRFAWVGAPRHGVIAKLASAGEDAGYLNRLVTPPAPVDAASRAPTERAWATGQPFFVNDLLNAPTSAPWAAEAERAGFRASAALPFRERGRVASVLNLYASEQGFFRDELTGTLEELALAVSSALDAMASERERAHLVSHLEERVKELSLLHATARLLQASRPFGRELLSDVVRLIPPAWQFPECCGARIRIRDVEVTTPDFRETPWMQSAGFAGGAGRVDVVYTQERPWGSEGPFLSEERALLESFAEMLSVYEGRHRASEQHAHAESQLRQAQKMQALGTLAGGIAHDFNNILTAILGNVELAAMYADPDARIADHLDQVIKAGERASDLVRRILVFARQEATDRRVIDVRQPVQEAVKLLRAALPASIRIEVDTSEILPKVLADSTQLHQVVMNLGVNAGHAMKAGGVLRLSLELTSVGDGQANGGDGPRTGDHLLLTIQDTGEGMTEEVLERAFEPFFTTKDPNEGTGLGLSVVHGIVKAHEGAIAIDSRVGAGTTVRIWIPATTQSKVALETAGTSPGAGGGQRLFYVDDEPQVVEVMVQRIERLGYRATGFTNPRLALQAFLAHPRDVDAVIVDRDMPEMDGSELAAALRRVRPELPIGVTSGLHRRGDDSVRSDLFAVSIPKPSTKAELERALASLTAHLRRPPSAR